MLERSLGKLMNISMLSFWGSMTKRLLTYSDQLVEINDSPEKISGT